MRSLKYIFLFFWAFGPALYGQLPAYELQWGTPYRYRDVQTQDILDMDAEAFYTYGSRYALLTAGTSRNMTARLRGKFGNPKWTKSSTKGTERN